MFQKIISSPKVVSCLLLVGVSTASALAYPSFRSYCNGPMVDRSLMDRTNLQKRVIVITGVAPGGIGYETARCLYEKNGTVVLAVRDVKKGEETKQQIISNVKNRESDEKNREGEICVMKMDLNDLQSVSDFAHEFHHKFSKCDMLINNAGISNVPHALSKQHVEQQFAVNHLGHFLLTLLLLDKLKESKGRVVVVASRAHESYKPSSFKVEDVLNNTGSNTHPHVLYRRSKFANVLFTKKLDRLLKEDAAELKNGVNDLQQDRCVAVCLHPGLIASHIGRYSTLMNVMLLVLGTLFGKTPVYGAQTTLYCALEDQQKLRGGAYYADCKEKPCNPAADSIQLQDELWNTSLKLVESYLNK
ncbi:hypothetical protein C9374_003970 [Naegleria lovaniensis]|uniref:Uncharacterized protein n=1 Tax=Naegleria lovaniensis TaxID=51637 RepID=A0AA88KSK6_NAELO|nr:uncharacterized protein C9374_003970 [Naegleria lovaniensis]KAG2394206.1 hypothetical protein C9374_003970 [Naegleria lovaniensis]